MPPTGRHRVSSLARNVGSNRDSWNQQLCGAPRCWRLIRNGHKVAARWELLVELPLRR